MSSLSVMILCGRSPRHLYVANRLCESARPVAIVQETGMQWSAKKIVRTLRRGGLWRKASRLLRDRRRFRRGAEARFFFGTEPARLARQELLLEVSNINHPDVVALEGRLQPDVIAVFGTSLIHGPLLSSGRLGIFNLHGGLSPKYRGADCTFWALFNGEPDQVGCTLHRIDNGIDTGTLIAHICPEVDEGDGELTLFWRGVRDSAEVYAEMLERLARGERVGEPQREWGRLYQVKDRTWRAERQLATRMRDGLLRGLHLPARVRWFGVPAPNSTATPPRGREAERER
jgi:folate-dependent phosphoribosylglycinamide formyltransferase PurN